MHVPPTREAENILSPSLHAIFIYIPGVTKAAGPDFEIPAMYHGPKHLSIMPVAASLSLYRQSPSRTMSAVSMVYKEDLAIARSTMKIQGLYPQFKKKRRKSPRGMSKWMAAAAIDHGTSASTNIYL